MKSNKENITASMEVDTYTPTDAVDNSGMESGMPITLLLAAATVNNIFKDCLFRGEELSETGQLADGIEYIAVQGLTMNVGFHRERLLSHQDDVQQLLAQLPFDVFEHSEGKGMSFLLLCMSNANIQWAEQKTVQELIMLGLGLNELSYLLPRDMWEVLPGGVPYIQVKQNKYVKDK